jgi:hypothetical protein
MFNEDDVGSAFFFFKNLGSGKILKPLFEVKFEKSMSALVGSILQIAANSS